MDMQNGILVPPPIESDGVGGGGRGGGLSAEDDAKLVFGTVFSLRGMVRRLGGEGDRYASFFPLSLLFSFFRFSVFLSPGFFTLWGMGILVRRKEGVERRRREEGKGERGLTTVRIPPGQFHLLSDRPLQTALLRDADEPQVCHGDGHEDE